MVRTDVDYSARPNKGLVRARILNIIEESFRPRHIPNESVAYISFAGYQWLDCLEFYRRFNIRNVYSIENHRRRYRRAKFNRPYEFFDLFPGEVPEFLDEKLAEIADTRKAIYLDYEARFGDLLLRDLEALFASSFFDQKGLLFITFNTRFTRDKLSPEAKQIVPPEIESRNRFELWITEQFSAYILNQVQRRYRERKQVTEVLKAFYRDTFPMVALGYLIGDSDDEVVPLIRLDEEKLILPVLTSLERNYIFNNLQKPTAEIAETVGVKESFIKSVIRYA